MDREAKVAQGMKKRVIRDGAKGFRKVKKYSKNRCIKLKGDQPVLDNCKH